MSKYIDADKLKEVFDEHEDDYGYLHGYWEEFIDNAPTADVRENVRGEWVQHTIGGNVWSIDKDTCSVCKETFYQISETGCVWNFCPNCGADMRREDNGRDEENHNRV